MSSTAPKMVAAGRRQPTPTPTPASARVAKQAAWRPSCGGRTERTLVEEARGVAVHDVQERRQEVAPHERRHVVDVVEGHRGQEDPGVPCAVPVPPRSSSTGGSVGRPGLQTPARQSSRTDQVRDKEVDVVRHGVAACVAALPSGRPPWHCARCVLVSSQQQRGPTDLPPRPSPTGMLAPPASVSVRGPSPPAAASMAGAGRRPATAAPGARPRHPHAAARTYLARAACRVTGVVVSLVNQARTQVHHRQQEDQASE